MEQEKFNELVTKILYEQMTGDQLRKLWFAVEMRLLSGRRKEAK